MSVGRGEGGSGRGGGFPILRLMFFQVLPTRQGSLLVSNILQLL